jgi:hypothetical protein
MQNTIDLLRCEALGEARHALIAVSIQERRLAIEELLRLLNKDEWHGGRSRE